MNLKERLVMMNDVEDLQERANNTLLFYLGYSASCDELNTIATEFLNDEKDTIDKYRNYLLKLVPRFFSVTTPFLKMGYLANQEIKFMYKDALFSGVDYINDDESQVVYAVPGNYNFDDYEIVVSDTGTARIIMSNGTTSLLPAVPVKRGNGVFIMKDLVKMA